MSKIGVLLLSSVSGENVKVPHPEVRVVVVSRERPPCHVPVTEDLFGKRGKEQNRTPSVLGGPQGLTILTLCFCVSARSIRSVSLPGCIPGMGNMFNFFPAP